MDTFERWVEQAKFDLDTARAMLGAGRYLYVLFCCQQAVEKMLKAVITSRTGTFPPRIHTLVRLAETASLPLEEESALFFRELSTYYIQTRYPEEVSSMAAKISEEQSRSILNQTEETIQWLHSMK